MGGSHSRETIDVFTAINEGNWESLSSAITKGSDKINWDALDNDQRSVLITTLRCERFSYEQKADALRLLITKVSPATLDARDRRGWAPLHYAAEKGLASSVSVLLNNNADPWALDLFGRTPRQLTENNSHPLASACAKLLVASEKDHRSSPYSVEAPTKIQVGQTSTVTVKAPISHSPSDYVQIYRLVEKDSWNMTPRMGAYALVPEGTELTLTIPVGNIEPDQYIRFLYVRSDISTPVAASQSVYVVENSEDNPPLPSVEALPWLATLEDQPDVELLLRVNRILYKKLQAFLSDKKSFITEANARSGTATIPAALANESHLHLAKIALRDIPSLEELRFKICPTFLRDDLFWRNFFQSANAFKAEALQEVAPAKIEAPVANEIPKVAVDQLTAELFKNLSKLPEIQEFPLTLETRLQEAIDSLQASDNLQLLRFELVPGRLSEIMFWKVFFATRP